MVDNFLLQPDFTQDVNAWLASIGIPLQGWHLPTRPQRFTKSLNPYLPKEFKDKVGIWVYWNDYEGISYPVVVANCFKHNIDKQTYSGFNFLRESLALDTPRPRPKWVPIAKQKIDKNEQAQKAKQLGRIQEVRKIYDTATDAMGHPYLERKGLSDLGTLFKRASFDVYGVTSDFLIAQLTTSDGKEDCYQVIGATKCFSDSSSSSSDKRPIGATKGYFFPINMPIDYDCTDRILICEGIATGLSLFQADQSRHVACAMSAYGYDVAISIAELYPNATLGFCIDNDGVSEDKNNVGLNQVQKLLKKISSKGCRVYMPPILDGEKTDWNDYAIKSGPVTDDVLKVNKVTGLNSPVPSNIHDLLEWIEKQRGKVALASVTNIAYKIAKSFIIDSEYLTSIAARWPKLAEEIQKVNEQECSFYSLPLSPATVSFDGNYLPVYFNLSAGTLDRPNIYLIKSPLGSGKTQMIKRFLTGNRGNSLYITHRITLTQSIAVEMGIDCYDQLSYSQQRKANDLAICINSVPNLAGVAGCSRDVVIIDESEQVIRQITTDLIKDKKRLITSLDEVLERSHTVILADADLSGVSESFICNTFKRLGRKYELHIIENTFKRFEGLPCHVIPNSSDCISKVMEWAGAGEKIFVATNSIDRAKQIEQAAKSAGFKTIAVYSDNSNTKEIFDFIANINHEVSKYDVVIASPAITSGVSITCEYFTKVVGIFSDKVETAGPSDCRQMLARVRKAREVYISYDSGVHLDLPRVFEAIQANFSNAHDFLYPIGRLENGNIEMVKHPYYDIYTDVTYAENNQKCKPREAFLTLMKSDGWAVIPFRTTKDDNKKGKEIKKEAKEVITNNEIAAISSAGDIPRSERVKLEHATVRTAEQNLEIKKYDVKEFFGDATSETVQAAYDDKRLMFKVRIHELLAADRSDVVRLTTFQARECILTWSEPHFKNHDLTKEFYTLALAVYDGGRARQDSFKVKGFVEWVLSQLDKLNANGLRVKSDIQNDPLKYIGGYVKRIGYTTERKQETIEGKRVSVYSLDTLDKVVSDTLEKRKALGKNWVLDSLRKHDLSAPPAIPENKPVSDDEPQEWNLSKDELRELGIVDELETYSFFDDLDGDRE